MPENTALQDPDSLVALFNNGDQKAFTQIYDDFYQRLYFFALRFVGAPDAKDVTSEAFIRLWERRSTFSSWTGLSNFLFVIVRNRCLDILKHQVVKSRKHGELLYTLENSEENDLSIEQLKARLIALLYKELNNLPPKMREIFLLSFEEGLKPAEIAAKLKLSPQTVSNQKLTAIRLLKASLGKHSLVLSMLLELYAE